MFEFMFEGTLDMAWTCLIVSWYSCCDISALVSFVGQLYIHCVCVCAQLFTDVAGTSWMPKTFAKYLFIFKNLELA